MWLPAQRAELSGQRAEVQALGVDDGDRVRREEAHADGNGIALTAAELHIAIPALLERLQSHKLELARLSTRQASLEDVFVNLTGRHLRDEEVPSF